MKKQINPTIKAHLIRGAFYLLLLLAVCAIPFALAQRNATKPPMPSKPGVAAKMHVSASARDTALTAATHAQQPKIPAMDASQLPKSSTGFMGAPSFRLLPVPKLPAVTLYDQYNNAGTTGTNSQDFETAFDAFDDFTADDFVVPAGQTWNITEVDVQGSYFNCTTCGPAASFNVFFYQDSGTLPGTLVATRVANTYTGTTDFVITLTSAVTLTPGTYWVSVQARLDFGTGGQWAWQDRTIQSNSGAAFENPGGGFACPGGNGWVRKPTCVATTSPDQVFRLVGTIGGGGTPTPTATATPSCSPNYTFTSGTGTVIPGVTDTGNHCDDCVTVVSLPFAVSLYDQTFTSASVGSNGILAFGTNNNSFSGMCLPVTGATYQAMPFFRDQRTDTVSGCTGCGIFTTTTGTAPNRIFSIEYRTTYFGEASATPTLDYEVNLYESGSPAFDFTYGLVNSTTNTGRITSIGVQQNATVFTQYACDTTGQNPPVATGQKLTATLIPCSSPTPTPTGNPSCTAGPLWYNGDFDDVNGLANENNDSLGSGPIASVYDDFIVPSGPAWNVTSVFSDNLLNTNVTGATWEIRQGVAEGTGGTLIASGMTMTPVVTATGRSGFGFTEFMVEVIGLNVSLPPGTYWLNVTPVGDLTGRSFDSTTSGANCVGMPCGNDLNAFFNSAFFGANWQNTAEQGQPSDFSMGVNGTVGTCGTPTATPTASPSATATATFTPTPTAPATATPTAPATATPTASPTCSPAAGQITTLFASNNSGSPGGANYFDVTVAANSITVTALDINTSATTAFSNVRVYVLPGMTFAGNETNMGLWTQVATGSGTGAGQDVPTHVTLSNSFTLNAGTLYGIAVVADPTIALFYTNGTGSNQNYSNADLSLFLGSATNVPFTAPVFSPRVWNGTIYYTTGAPCGTPTPTATATGSCTPGDVIVNGGFETGTFPPWVIDGHNNDPVISTAQVHSGTFSALAGNESGAEPLGDSSFYQQFAVPAAGGTLSFWHWDFTTDTITFDWQDAYITDSSGNILQTIFHQCVTSGGWVQQTVDMTPYAGQTVRIKFLVHQDGFGDDTAMYVDDVSLPGGCGGASPTPTGTPSATPTCQPGGSPGPWMQAAPVAIDHYGGFIDSDGTFAYEGGGYSFSASGTINQFGKFNPTTNTWTPLAPVPDLTNAEASGVYAPNVNKLFVFGGDDPTTGTVVNTTRIYDIATNTWSTGTPMPDVRAFMASGYFNGKIYLVGGYSTGNVDPSFGQVWEYDPVANTFNTTRMSMPATLGGPGFGIINGHMYSSWWARHQQHQSEHIV